MDIPKDGMSSHDSQTIDTCESDSVEVVTVTILQNEYIDLVLGERNAEIRAEEAEFTAARLFTGRSKAICRAEVAEQEVARLSQSETSAKVECETHKEDAARLRKDLREANQTALQLRKELEQARRQIEKLERATPFGFGVPDSGLVGTGILGATSEMVPRPLYSSLSLLSNTEGSQPLLDNGFESTS